METIIQAIVGAVISIGGAVTAYFSWKAKQASEKVDKKTATNHGREPWEYLEMVMEVRDSLVEVKDSLVDFKEYQHTRNHDLINSALGTKGRLAAIDHKVTTLSEQLVEHAEHDAENFGALSALIKENNTDGS